MSRGRAMDDPHQIAEVLRGKTVVSLSLDPATDNRGRQRGHLNSIRFTDGSRLHLGVAETDEAHPPYIIAATFYAATEPGGTP